MFKMEISQMVCFLRKTLLPQTKENLFPIDVPNQPYGHRTMHGIHVCVDILMVDFGYAEDGNTKVRDEVRREGVAHFLFCGSTNVFFAMGDFGSCLPSLDQFENTGNHNSCWDDGVRQPLNSLYFQWTEEVAPHLAPRDVSQHCSLEGVAACVITHEPKDPHNPYWRKLVEVKDFREVLR